MREQQQLYGADLVLIEEKASGIQLIQELKAEGCGGVTTYQPTTDKVMRMHAQTALIENGFVVLPESAPSIAEYPTRSGWRAPKLCQSLTGGGPPAAM